MASSSMNSCTTFDVVKQEITDPFHIPIRQLPHSFDFSGCEYLTSPLLDSQHGFLAQETFIDAAPFMESLLPDPLYYSFETIQSFSHQTPAVLLNNENDMVIWSAELGSLPDPNQSTLVLYDSTITSGDSSMEIVLSEGERKREIAIKKKSKNISSNSVFKVLTRETLSKYFYMPITQAAKELDVGLTLLKKRCRELGIQRWPHRKLMSLDTLIKNVKELGKMEGEEGEGKIEEEIRKLEREKRRLEESPDMQLEPKTKRLRQACFKANYKKKKLINSSGTGGIYHPLIDDDVKLLSSSLISPGSSESTSMVCSQGIEDEDEDDEIKYLLYDPDMMF